MSGDVEHELAVLRVERLAGDLRALPLDVRVMLTSTVIRDVFAPE